MRQIGTVGRSLQVCLGIAATAVLVVSVVQCSHPSTKGSTSTGTGGVGGDDNPSGGGAGGRAPNGSGGKGGAGPAGTGGSGEVVVTNPDGGTGPTGMVMKMACADDPNQQKALPYTPGYVISDAAKKAAADAVAAMTLTAKADQLRNNATSGYGEEIFRTNDAGGIRGFQFRDGPRGVNLDAVKTAGQQGYTTVFPVPMARGAGFDVDLEYQIGQAMGDEMVAARATMMLAPTVNILRHPAWGRAQETYGEDSFLLGRLGTAYTVGVQEYVPACVKHYAANNIERDRANANAAMDDQTLHDVYARHFGMIIQDGGVSCVMAAYNLIQVGAGTPKKCTQNGQLLNQMLRTEFGFKGMTLTDWWAMPGGQTPPENSRQPTANEAIAAGLDMELPWRLHYARLESVPNGEPLVTQAALRVVTEKFRFNVNMPGTGAIGLKPATTRLTGGNITNNESHVALATKAALEGMVLLKNDASTLPIKDTVKKVAVLGLQVPWKLNIGGSGSVNFATDARIGDLGSSRVNADPAKSVGPTAGLMAAAPAGTMVTAYSQDNAATAAAVAAADFVVIVAGLTPEDEGEEYTITPINADRNDDLGLDGKAMPSGFMKVQDAFITKYAQMAKTANKPLVVVLEGGSAILMPWYADVPAVVMAWYPGQTGGTALGQLLFGKANFSGKLPITWPAKADDEPQFSGGATTQMGYHLGYRWFDTQNKVPLFPFGHGLSYTKFEHSNLQVPCSTVTAKGVINVTVDVKNTGTVAGDEIVFLFVSFPGSKIAVRAGASYKELKGFRRVSLDPGQTKRVTIPVRVSDLNYYDIAAKAWKVEPGMVKIMVGPNASATGLTLTDTVAVQ